MAKCSRCGKRSLFLRCIDGMCYDCFAVVETERKTHPKTPDTAIVPPPKDIQTLTNSRDRSAFHAAIVEGCHAVYRYPFEYIENVNISVLAYLYRSKNYALTVTEQPDGKIHLIANTPFSGIQTVGKLVDRVNMCRDWIKRGDPIQCELVSFRPGFERVSLMFYRNELKKLEGRPSKIVKLTSCMSSDAQEAIRCLVNGEKLFIDEDDGSRPYVRSIYGDFIGKLPAGEIRSYEDGIISGIFLHHTDEIEDCNCETKEIPYVVVFY